jgi:hypothetical protein
MATLLLALALETRYLGRHCSPTEERSGSGCALILGWVVIGMYRACVVAANGSSFTRFEDAVVAGSLSAVTCVVVLVAVVGALDERRTNRGRVGVVFWSSGAFARAGRRNANARLCRRFARPAEPRLTLAADF